jgi:hypothetical protein
LIEVNRFRAFSNFQPRSFQDINPPRLVNENLFTEIKESLPVQAPIISFRYALFNNVNAQHDSQFENGDIIVGEIKSHVWGAHHRNKLFRE